MNIANNYHCLRVVKTVSDKIFVMKDITNHNIEEMTKMKFLFIAASCDERSYKISNIILGKSNLVEKMYIFDYKKFQPTKDQEQEYATYYNYMVFKDYEIIKCENEDDDIHNLNKIHIEPTDCIGIDITGFSIPDIFRIFYVLRQIKSIRHLHVFYSEPRYYYYSNGLFDTYELLSGERKYTQIHEYFASGSQQKEILVCFLGFDKMVSKWVRELADPSEIVVINGLPSYMPKLKDISLVNNFDLLSMIDKDNIYFTRASNPYSAYNTLCDIKEKFNGALLNICVLGTKPMTLGACIFALDNIGTVKVTYPYPKSYKLKTTEESSRLWHYFIDFVD